MLTGMGNAAPPTLAFFGTSTENVTVSLTGARLALVHVPLASLTA
jgi:hypothetical protein